MLAGFRSGPTRESTDEDRAEVQSNMQARVLESNAYPDIVFRSTEVRRTGALVWRVSGDLTLHGVTRPVSVEVTRQNDAYVGTVRLKQTDFDIQPIKIGGGVVRVKDELEVSFRVLSDGRYFPRSSRSIDWSGARVRLMAVPPTSIAGLAGTSRSTPGPFFTAPLNLHDDAEGPRIPGREISRT